MMNYYTLEVYKKQNKPCFVVTIQHIMKAGIYFFKSLPEVNKFIAEIKNDLLPYAELKYNAEGINDKKIFDAINYVLNNDDIIIAENGKTYSKQLKNPLMSI